jgi:hypothetical protein
VNTVLTLPPTRLSAPIIKTAISEAIRAYSIAVIPESSLTKFFINFNVSLSESFTQGPLESVQKHHLELHNFRIMRRIEASLRTASAFRLRHSQSLASLRIVRARRRFARRSIVWATAHDHSHEWGLPVRLRRALDSIVRDRRTAALRLSARFVTSEKHESGWRSA